MEEAHYIGVKEGCDVFWHLPPMACGYTKPPERWQGWVSAETSESGMGSVEGSEVKVQKVVLGVHGRDKELRRGRERKTEREGEGGRETEREDSHFSPSSR